jgi:hypothetical protein
MTRVPNKKNGRRPPKRRAGGSFSETLWQENEMKRKSMLIFLCIMAIVFTACSERFTEYYPKYEDGEVSGVGPSKGSGIIKQSGINSLVLGLKRTFSVAKMRF